MTFEEYLISKKINIDNFEKNEILLFQNWKNIFEQMHFESFTNQKKFLINDIRRKYPL